MDLSYTQHGTKSNYTTAIELCSMFVFLCCAMVCCGVLWFGVAGFYLYVYAPGLLHWHCDKHSARLKWPYNRKMHYDDVIMGAIASQTTSLTIVYSTVYSDGDQRKYQSSASLAFVRGIHRGPVNSPHKWPVTRKMFPFDDVIMELIEFSIHFFIWQKQICTKSIHVWWVMLE